MDACSSYPPFSSSCSRSRHGAACFWCREFPSHPARRFFDCRCCRSTFEGAVAKWRRVEVAVDDWPLNSPVAARIRRPAHGPVGATQKLRWWVRLLSFRRHRQSDRGASIHSTWRANPRLACSAGDTPALGSCKLLLGRDGAPESPIAARLRVVYHGGNAERQLRSKGGR